MDKSTMRQLHEKGQFLARLRGSSAPEKDNFRQYLPVRSKNGQVLQGGNQNWWFSEGGPSSLAERKPKWRYLVCRRNEDYRMAQLGCGVIAMTNLELYLDGRYGRGSAAEEKGRQEGLTREAYKKYAGEKWNSTYRIGKSPVSYAAGLYPWKMERGLSRFLRERGSEWTNVTWAPFAWKAKKERESLTLSAILEMLRNDYPVVFSYHTFEPKKSALILYGDGNGALQGQEAGKDDARVTSHYMTILGVWKSAEGQILLQVESWGRIYYVRYEIYAKKLSYFTNILLISK